MSKLKITGNSNPIVGELEKYSVDDFFQKFNLHQNTISENHSSNVFDNQIKWSIWILDKGSWRKTKENDKTGATVNYTFHQKSLTRKGIKMLVEANGEKDILDITPKPANQAKIIKVDLLDADFSKPTRPFAYGDSVIARVHCVDMERFPLLVTLWEDDSPGAGHNKANTFIKSQKGTVLNGKADVEFYLDPSISWLANARLAPGDKNEGTNHEYYVTAEVFEKIPIKRVASSNTNVPNPDYKPEITKPKPPSPASKKEPSKKDQKEINKSEQKVHDYHEQKVTVQNKVSFNPIWEKINSAMKVWMPDDKNKKENTCVCKENNFYWSNKLTCKERKKVLEVCSNLWGEANKKEKASELMSIIHLESANTFSPTADNGVGFSGLIQFSDAAAKTIGTTRGDLKKMTFIEQMDYVKKYFEPKKNQLTTMTDLYLLVLKPNAVGNGNKPDYILFDESISVPDGDGSNTSYEQRMININREPWVTKYGYASNPPFMKENDERKLREKWVYTRQRKEQRWGFHNGKTTVGEVTQELKEQHYNKGASQIFKGACEDIVEKKTEDKIEELAPWMKVAWEEFDKYKGIKEEDNPLKEKIEEYFKETGYNGNYKNAWCAAFINWCFDNTTLYKDTNSKGAMAARDWGPEGNSYVTGSGKDGWVNGETTDAFIGAVAVIKSHSHVVFIIGVNSKGDFVNLGGNQGSKVSGGQKICMGSMPKSDVLYIMKPKNYIVQEGEKKLPLYDIDAVNDSKSTR